MNYFLAKTEPSTYSVEDFQNEGVSVWSGVKSPQALKYIRSMQPGDRVFIYHSTGQSAIVGLAEVISEPEPDPKIKKSWMVEMEFLQMISPPVTLKEIKQSGLFEDFRLVYQSRLSTMDVPENFVEWLRKVKRLKI
jgi:predicted RNA-binding protein with PUA-like domain